MNATQRNDEANSDTKSISRASDDAADHTASFIERLERMVQPEYNAHYSRSAWIDAGIEAIAAISEMRQENAKLRGIANEALAALADARDTMARALEIAANGANREAQA